MAFFLLYIILIQEGAVGGDEEKMQLLCAKIELKIVTKVILVKRKNLLQIGHNTGLGNTVVSQSRVSQVRIRCHKLKPRSHHDPSPRCHGFLWCCIFVVFL